MLEPRTADPPAREPDTPGIDSLGKEDCPVKRVMFIGTRDLEPREAWPTAAGRDRADDSTRSQGHAGLPAPDPIAERSMATGGDAVARSIDGHHRQPGGPLRVPAVCAEDVALWFG